MPCKRGVSTIASKGSVYMSTTRGLVLPGEILFGIMHFPILKCLRLLERRVSPTSRDPAITKARSPLEVLAL